MQLGIAYNFFNGEEHLLASLRSVRNSASYICVVFQEFSNSGEPCSDAARSVLREATESNLIDECVMFEPDLGKPRATNETRKRQIGLDRCKTKRCTHFLSMDADEFYRGHEFEKAKAFLENNNIHISTVPSFFHLKSPQYRCLDTTMVPFICKINCLTRTGAARYPVRMTDPTRRIWNWPRRHHLFDESSIAMYHMNFVRSDFTSKFANTSTTDTAFLDTVKNKILTWSYPETFVFPGKGEYQMVCVPNEFSTYDPLEKGRHED